MGNAENADLIHQEKLALFCSARCLGRLILQTYDLAQRLRQSGLIIMGGFHTPMEKECLAYAWQYCYAGLRRR